MSRSKFDVVDRILTEIFRKSKLFWQNQQNLRRTQRNLTDSISRIDRSNFNNLTIIHFMLSTQCTICSRYTRCTKSFYFVKKLCVLLFLEKTIDCYKTKFVEFRFNNIAYRTHFENHLNIYNLHLSI